MVVFGRYISIDHSGAETPTTSLKGLRVYMANASSLPVEVPGEVIAVGPGALDDNGKRGAPEVKAGDIVLFGRWSGTEVKMKESDINGIVEGRKTAKKAA